MVVVALPVVCAPVINWTAVSILAPVLTVFTVGWGGSLYFIYRKDRPVGPKPLPEGFCSEEASAQRKSFFTVSYRTERNTLDETYRNRLQQPGFHRAFLFQWHIFQLQEKQTEVWKTLNHGSLDLEWDHEILMCAVYHLYYSLDVFDKAMASACFHTIKMFVWKHACLNLTEVRPTLTSLMLLDIACDVCEESHRKINVPNRRHLDGLNAFAFQMFQDGPPFK